MKKIETYLVLLLSLALYSCGSTMQLVSFDQLEASQVNFPESVRRVAVVNNLPPHNNPVSKKEIPISLVGNGVTASSTLATALADAHYFDQVVLCDSMFSLADTLTGVIPMEKVNALTEELGVDLLFTVDSLNITNRLISYGYYAELVAVLQPQIKVYVPERKIPLLTIAKKDTLYWTMNPNINSSLIVEEASSYVAHRVIPFIVPYWKNISRSYYDSGNYQMRDAAIFVQEGNWEEAFLLWKTIYDTSKGKASRMRAAYNMALYYEINEDLDKALELLGEASKLVSPNSIDASFIKFYTLQLQERISKLSKLNIQMKRFSENF